MRMPFLLAARRSSSRTSTPFLWAWMTMPFGGPLPSSGRRPPLTILPRRLARLRCVW